MAAKGLKRPKSSEVNYLPEHPEGQNGDSLEAVRQLLVEEMRKVNPSGTFIASKMDLTFSMRRHEIVDAETPVKTLMERWPALFTERQVSTHIKYSSKYSYSFFDHEKLHSV